MDLALTLESLLRNRLNTDSPSWHVEVMAEPIVHAVMEFSVPVKDVMTQASRIKWAGQLTRTCCRNGMRRPLGVSVVPDGALYSVKVVELEYRKRGPATAIADLFREFKEARG
jgi:hypothetical protein